MEYYSAVNKKKKKKILPLVTVWMDLENIMLREISEQFHFYVESNEQAELTSKIDS